MVKCNFNDWSLNSQVKFCILPLTFILCVAFTIHVNYLLILLQSEFKENYSKMLYEKELTHTKILALNHKDFITEYLKNKVDFIKHYRDINRLILGFESDFPPTIAPEPKYHSIYKDKPSDYSTGCFMSPKSISSEGEVLIKKQAGMDEILPIIRSEDYLYIYSAFEIDEIIHYNPAEYTSDPDYTPKVREWYYKAKDLPDHAYITEPYFDFTTGLVVITISVSIKDEQGKFFGVSACDVTIQTLTELLSNIKILNNGFILLVTTGGMVLNLPPTWGITLDSPLRVYQQDKTGISQDLWFKISNGEDEEILEYSRTGIDYLIMKYSIKPIDGSITSHFMLIFVDKGEIYNPFQDFSESFDYYFDLIIFLVISLLFLSFTITFFLITWFLRSTLRIFNYLESSFKTISSRAAFPTLFLDYQQREFADTGLFRWISGTIKQRIQFLDSKEKEFSHFEWGSTRPSDQMVYPNWKRKCYPLNSFEEQCADWSKSLEKIPKDSPKRFLLRS